MIRYHPTLNIVTMSLADLEHCGFHMTDFHDELFTSGMPDDEAERAGWPLALLVNVAGGYAIQGGTNPRSKRMTDYRSAVEAFDNLVARLESAGMAGPLP